MMQVLLRPGRNVDIGNNMGAYLPTTRLSFSEATAYVRAGGSVFASSRQKTLLSVAEYDNEIARKLLPYCISTVKGIRTWSNNLTSRNNLQMHIFRCCKNSRGICCEIIDGILMNKDGFPEDICFYRRDTVWFATVTPESLAFVYNPTVEDMGRLNLDGNGYLPLNASEVFSVPRSAF